MVYLDVGSSRRALTRDNGPGALVGYAAEQEGSLAPVHALGPCAFRLQVPLTTEPRGSRQHNEEMYKKVSTNSVQQSDATSR